ncbi:MAG: hypothetical protein AAGD14_07195 [Planctomycetota bacterium]
MRALVATALLASLAAAEPEKTPPSADDLHRGLESYLEATTYAGSNGHALEMRSVHARLELAGGVPLPGRILLRANVSWGISAYDFDIRDGRTLDVPTTDFDRFQSLSLGLQAIYVATPRFGILLGFQGGPAGDTRADFSDSLTYGATLAVRLQPINGLTLRLGVGAFDRFTNSTFVLPIFGAEWSPSARWFILLGFPRLAIEYEVVPGLRIFLAGLFEFHDYRLADGGALPNGVFHEQAFGLGIGIEWRFAEGRGRLRFLVGTPLSHEISLDDEEGNEVFQDDLDPGLAFRVRFEWRW